MAGGENGRSGESAEIAIISPFIYFEGTYSSNHIWSAPK